MSDKNYPMTDKQKKTMQVIDEYIKKHGEGPTTKELATLLSLGSYESVLVRLKTLAEKEFIFRKPEGWEGRQPPRYIKINEDLRSLWEINEK